MCYNVKMKLLMFINSIIMINALESRVFNGVELRPKVHGYLVRLDTNSGFYNSMCSGSIITADWIVTSAHCFPKPVELITIRQKTSDGYDTTLATASGNHIHKHPAYIDGDETVTNRENDIALLKTEIPISFNEYVWPIDLARIAPKVGQSVIIAGYGDSEFKDFEPREALLHVVSCPYDVKSLLCTNDKARAGAADSGGSLVSKGKLVAVTSGSCKSAEKMDVEKCVTAYASVSVHLKWIESVTTRN